MTYLLDGADLENYARLLSTIDADLPIIGDDNAIPGRPGEIFARRTAGAGDLQLGMFVNGRNAAGDPDTVVQWQQNWKDTKALVWKTTGTRTLTRRMTLPAGVLESAAQATLVSLPQASMQGDRGCLTILEFKLLDGYFYDTTTVTISPAGTFTVDTDAVTSNMTITMGAGTLTNTTTGAVLTYSGTGTVTIDVRNWTAAVAGSSVAGQISWPVAGHDFWFDLAPGANVLTGTATIVYAAARLPA